MLTVGFRANKSSVFSLNPSCKAETRIKYADIYYACAAAISAASARCSIQY